MPRNPESLSALNEHLAEERLAINQYNLHLGMCDIWGDRKLHKEIEDQAADAMHRVHWLIRRIHCLDDVADRSHAQPQADPRKRVRIA